ncbi:hypothetical protein [Sphingobium yanoikuyae]|uniref:Uncharacterized protein n=1 Tax=Sphingobium yanoikuyae TaxID=13690 RepID=A0A291N077_SPHYA|nr:hypothetical protein [Sphingobium yanoikuyae]ATI80560.1 hypothetical protein A6768_11525 [Sphingobium yanoikuyae]
MWLVARHGSGVAGDRIAIPDLVRDALVRWYMGTGSRADGDAGIMLVQQARVGGKWIACDCLGMGMAPPILTPAFLSEAETYYLRRLTSPGRPEHHAACPFVRDQASNRGTQVRSPASPAEPPNGYFEILRLAPEKLARRPGKECRDDRTRQASVPRLARLLWRLLAASGLNRCPPLCQDRDDRSIRDEYVRLTRAAGHMEIAPGVELARAFWTYGEPLHSRRVYARLREMAHLWPPGHAPQSFLALFAREVHGSTVHVAGSDPVSITNPVHSPSIRGNRVMGPYLVLIVVGQYPQAHGYAPLRAYAQPILAGNRFMPVNSEFERMVLRDLIALRAPMDRSGIDLGIEKPVFDMITRLGSCRPDFLLQARSRSTGEVRQIVILAMGSGDAAGREGKAVSVPRMELIAPVLKVTPLDHQQGRIASLIAAALDLQ